MAVREDQRMRIRIAEYSANQPRLTQLTYHPHPYQSDPVSPVSSLDPHPPLQVSISSVPPHSVQPPRLPVHPNPIHRSLWLLLHPRVFDIVQDIEWRFDRRWERWYAIEWASVWPNGGVFRLLSVGEWDLRDREKPLVISLVLIRKVVPREYSLLTIPPS